MLDEIDPIGNNLSHQAITRANLADIRLLNLSNPAGVILPANTTIEYTFDIGNYGNAAVPASIPLNVYVDNTLLGTTTVEGPIEPGHGIHVAIAIRVDSTGSHTIKLQGNPNQSFLESNYNNNSVSGIFSYISDLTAVDVAAYELSASGAGVSLNQITCGTSVTFDIAVANYSRNVVSAPIKLLFNNVLAVGETVSLKARTITLLSVDITFNKGSNLAATLQVDPANTSGDWNMTNNEINEFYTLVETSSSEAQTVHEDILFASMAFNEDSGVGIMVPVSLSASATGQLNYRHQVSSTYLDRIASTISYQTDIYNPEVCTYNCELGMVEITSNSSSENVILSESQSLILPSNYTGSSKFKTYPDNSKNISMPFTAKYYYTITWSTNCVPAAWTDSLVLSISQ